MDSERVKCDCAVALAVIAVVITLADTKGSMARKPLAEVPIEIGIPTLSVRKGLQRGRPKGASFDAFPYMAVSFANA